MKSSTLNSKPPRQPLVPAALSIAGSDSGGGAGIQADLKTFSALGVFGTTAITAVTAQNTQGVTGIHEIPPTLVSEQLHAVLSDIRIGAIKIGMLSSPAIVGAVAEVLRDYRDIPVVLDPVMVAKTGDVLLQPEACTALQELLFPLAVLVTPNMPEAGLLTGLSEASNEAEIVAQATALQSLGCSAILMKGGHLSGQTCVDRLFSGSNMVKYSNPRIQTSNTHGTGCTLSSAIAAYLARGETINDAVAKAVTYLHQAIQDADSLHIGHGHGPVHHFHGSWQRHG